MRILLILSIVVLLITNSYSQNYTGINNVKPTTNTEQLSNNQGKPEFSVSSFGSGGQIKMIYDRRQRPQAIFFDLRYK